ncbi:MAG: alpha/beta hydrolase [Prolixibacteraceae bacterium]|nr:alpha/beta hydrolase [Prolixibacteraceae bacterium]MBN2775100.1 alpha/beta hydrolase [Prolixibacteraceae bacterium]
MKRIKRFLLIVLVLLIAGYLLGPKPPKPELNNDLPVIQGSLSTLESNIQKKESLEQIKPDNEARIIWANDSLQERTDYCLLYLHGFSASYYEGYPVNVEFARRYGCNAYFPRLASHGLITEDALIDMTPDRLWEDSKEALLVARTLGKKVVIMSTSTGGTLALKLAAEFPEYVEGLILYSPNIRINNGAAFLLSGPWGLQIARKVYDSKYRITNEDFESKDCQYWYCKYRLEAVVYLQQLIDATMKTEVYKRVTSPVFLGYYYKDEEHQDEVVKVDAMLDMFEKLGTSPDRKVKQAFPEAGEHVIACELTSGALEEVKKATFIFAENVLNMKPL